jgi:flagellin
MTSINTNAGALSARNAALNATSKMETAMGRLSSGLRINTAADDAAGLSVASKMTGQLGGIKILDKVIRFQ